MNVEELYQFCISIKKAEESLPFDEVSLVLKVCNKMFALIRLDASELQVSVKCDPDKAVELREEYSCVTPAYHFNKKYWNTIYLNREMNDETVKFWIRHSVEEVIKKLPAKLRNEYNQA
ncbi:MAG: MmcQ/YjbR family DNA-binding protein [Dysgonamonadaceae bacterium]|jgi:predicted DNA-binding protein (MmcQ/YjbR family)|nr:MmcQ/YjbR family DNA-binding protein [Dysgonamonadaceae bacterium]